MTFYREWLILIIQTTESKMQTYTIIISEEQLLLIQKVIDQLPNNIYLEKDEIEELSLISSMITDTIEEEDKDIVQGFCY